MVKLDQDFGSAFAGVLTDDSGAVRAVWGSYSEQGTDKEDREWCAGLPVAVATPWIERLRRSLAASGPAGSPVGAALNDDGAAEGLAEGEAGDASMALAVRVLDAELEALTMSKAASYGLPEAWVGRLTRFDPVRRQVQPWPPCLHRPHRSCNDCFVDVTISRFWRDCVNLLVGHPSLVLPQCVCRS